MRENRRRAAFRHGFLNGGIAFTFIAMIMAYVWIAVSFEGLADKIKWAAVLSTGLAVVMIVLYIALDEDLLKRML